MDLEQELSLVALRTSFLVHTRKAYALLPNLVRPRILDFGCGRGLQTMELARLSDGNIVAMDPDEGELVHVRRRVEDGGLSHRIRVVCASIYDPGFPDGGFDLLWEEGVMHLLDATKSLPQCHRLLAPGGFLMMHEDVTWFGSVREGLADGGFQVVGQYLLPKHAWWTAYYAPLESMIRELKRRHEADSDAAALAEYERQVSAVKVDPGRYDCGFFLLQKQS